MRLLHLDSSITGPASISRTLSAEVVKALTRGTPDVTVTYRDLVSEPLSHLVGAHMAARSGQSDVAPSIQADVAKGNAALDEFLAADVVVIGAPMYNFAIPSQLKAWIDRIGVADKTFKYGPNGPEGLAGGKRVIVVSSRGGFYSAGSPAAAADHQETYLRAIFGFLGINDVEFVRAEGLAVGGQRDPSMAAARTTIASLA